MEITPATPLANVMEDLYLPGNLRITSDSTLNHYRITIRHLRAFLGREPLLSDLTDATCIRFCRWYQETRDLAAPTINQRLEYLKAFWRWCARERFVEKWPNFHKLPESKPLPRAWTAEQIATLLNACQETPGFVTCIPAGEWWCNIHRFAWETGERIGAILKARWADTDPERCLVEIPAKYRKGKCRGMLYTISGELMADLLAMRPGDEPLLFPWHLTTKSFYKDYTKLLKRAGLPTDRRSKMHKMRRSFASHLEAAGGNATDALKHTSRRVTDESYLDESIIQRAPAYKSLPAIERKGEVKQ